MADVADTYGDRTDMEFGIADMLEDAELLDTIVDRLFEGNEAWEFFHRTPVPDQHLFMLTAAQLRNLYRVRTHVFNSARKLHKLFHGDDHV